MIFSVHSTHQVDEDIWLGEVVESKERFPVWRITCLTIGTHSYLFFTSHSSSIIFHTPVYPLTNRANSHVHPILAIPSVRRRAEPHRQRVFQSHEDDIRLRGRV